MSATRTNDWNNANQHYLMAAVRAVQEELEQYHASREEGRKDASKKLSASQAQKELKKAARALSSPSALDILVDTFGLSAFERNILLMCAGVELDAGFSSLIGKLQGSDSLQLPSFSLALAAFPDSHWSALSPGAPLRYWRLIELSAGQSVAKGPLKIDEHVLHYIAGVRHLNEQLRMIAEPVSSESILVSSQYDLANRILQVWSQLPNNIQWPIIQLGGENQSDKAAIAFSMSSHLGLSLYTVSAGSIPRLLKEGQEFIRLWNRESALNSFALLLDCSEVEATDKDQIQSITRFIEEAQGLVFMSTGQWMPKTRRRIIPFDLFKPTPEEQLSLWKGILNKEANEPDEPLEKLVSQFNLSAKTIQSIGLTVSEFHSASTEQNAASGNLEKKIWEACCVHTRPSIEHLAQRIEPVATWEDIVLPEGQKEVLKEIAIQVEQRKKVYSEWGFAGKSSRGLGISALFSGESGTGKTLAAEVLANELRLDLYRIDLSQIVNKYIGETEKNLKRVFDAAEEGGAILLFDEADALFGKRSDVKDSHDRYANIEVSYLLQRMEAYRGLAILTTNMKSSLDKAFFRRIRFVVQFPFPDASLRSEIWRRVFPTQTPTANLDMEKLARLNIPGGNIKNIALNAAFLAASEGLPVQMPHILRAARSEYNKLEKPLSNNEIAAW